MCEATETVWGDWGDLTFRRCSCSAWLEVLSFPCWYRKNNCIIHRETVTPAVHCTNCNTAVWTAPCFIVTNSYKLLHPSPSIWNVTINRWIGEISKFRIGVFVYNVASLLCDTSPGTLVRHFESYTASCWSEGAQQRTPPACSLLLTYKHTKKRTKHNANSNWALTNCIF